MGARGPRPMPTNLRILKGDPNRARYNLEEPKPRPDLPAPPDDASPEVLKVWASIVEEMSAMDTAFASDSDALRCYCEAVVIHRKASAVLAKSPILVKGLHGNLVRNPALQIQRDAAQTVRGFAQEFGLTPSARSTVHAKGRDDGDDVNPFAGTG